MLKIHSDERRWLTLRTACAIIWAMELFWVQGVGFEAAPWVRYPVLFQIIRFCLDLVVTLALSLLVRRRFLLPLLIGNAFFLAGVGAYAAYFHRPLMPAGVLYRWSEGISVRSYAGAMIPFHVIGVVFTAFMLKVALLIKSDRSKLPAWTRWRMGLYAALLYILPVCGLQFTQFKLSSEGNMERVIYAYGYTLPWLFDSLGSLNLRELAERAKAYSESHLSDRLTPLEKPLGVRSHVLVVQLETIGTQIIDATYRGFPVMPFMKELKSKSMYFRIEAFHSNGSCDMDFAAATFTRPYPFVVPYRLPGIQYNSSMPAFMKQYGYRTYVFHGNTQLFFYRGPFMDRLGFDHIVFKEQLAGRRLKSSIMGVRDAELFRCVAETVRSEAKVYAFIISLDTHAPFDLLEESEMEIFSRPTRRVEKYLNSARYLDNCLRELVNRLPDGATLMLYGDHTASMIEDLLVSDVEKGVEYVPCLIYEKGKDLSRFQQTRAQGISTNGTLNLLDMMGYLRNSVSFSFSNHLDTAVSAP
jgi:hypothetical protein